MAQPKPALLKGDFASRLYGSTDGFDPMWNATAAQIDFAQEFIEQQSNGDTLGTLSKDEVSRTANFSVTLQARNKANLKKYLLAKSRVVASGTAVAFTLPALKADQSYPLAHAKVSNVVIGTLVAGTDYYVKPNTGVIVALKDMAAQTTGCSYDHDEFVEYGVFTEDAIELEVLFTSEKTGLCYQIYKLTLSASQAYQLVSDGNEYGSSTLTGTLLADPNAVDVDLLGRFMKVRGPNI